MCSEQAQKNHDLMQSAMTAATSRAAAPRAIARRTHLEPLETVAARGSRATSNSGGSTGFDCVGCTDPGISAWQYEHLPLFKTATGRRHRGHVTLACCRCGRATP